MNIYKYVERIEAPPKDDGSLLSRYAPKRTCDVVCNDISLLCIQQWFRERKKPFLVISGPSGIGKSALASLACREHGLRPMTVACSTVKTQRELDLVLDLVGSGDCLVVDDFDTVESAVLTGVKDFAKARPGLPVVFVCHKHNYGKPVDICKQAEVVAMRRPPRQKILEWIRSIVARETGFSPSLNVEELVDRCKGDVRQTLLSLEMNRNRAETTIISKKDPAVDAINVVEMIMQSREEMPVSFAMRLAHVDPSNVSTMASENYVDIGCPSLEAIGRAADAFSVADVLENHMYARQAWENYDAWLYFGAVYPMMCVRTQSSHAPRFTKMWSRTSKMYLRMGHLRTLKTHLPGAQSIDYVCGLSACMHAVLDREGPSGLVRAPYGSGIPSDLVPFVLRLSATRDIKQNQVNKIKQAYKKTSS
jgi:hypothetical protein